MPFRDTKVRAQCFDIRDQVLRCILLDLSMRLGFSGTSLVEKNHTINGRVEKSSVLLRSVTSRTTVQKDDCILLSGPDQIDNTLRWSIYQVCRLSCRTARMTICVDRRLAAGRYQRRLHARSLLT